MWRVVTVLAACTLLVGAAHGQVTAQFWVITENGNQFELDGPPPDRPPGFDTAPFLNIRPLNTALSMTAGAAPGAAPVATFGAAGSVTELKEYDPGRTEMAVTIVTDWGHATDSRYMYAPMLVGDLRVTSTGAPYMGPARINATAAATDLLEWCNAGPVNGTDVSCVDNYRGRDLSPTYDAEYGHVLDLPQTGRTIVHISGLPGTVAGLEIMFTCPECRMDAQAFHGSGGGTFMERGFLHPAIVATPDPPYFLRPYNLTGLAWGGVTDSNNIGYWQDGGPCTPALSISGGSIVGGCAGADIQAGTVGATAWQPLSPGWNLVEFPRPLVPPIPDNYVVIIDPGWGAKLQIREKDPNRNVVKCCHGFDGGVHNAARISGHAVNAAVVHTVDQHLLIIPYGGSVPADQATLAEAHAVQMAVREEPRSTFRWLSHSELGDPIYHGFMYDERGTWPPYQVRLVEARHIDFDLPALNILEEISWGNYTSDDLARVIRIDTNPGPLMDSEIYDIRNDRLLRSDEGRFILWDGTHIDRPYIQPWWNLQKNPVWETYGVKLPRDKMLVVDAYATIPMVKPTHLSNTYLSSLPCGYPDISEVTGPMWDAIADAAGTGGYDPDLIEFLVLTDGDGPITDNMRLQHIYMASRTYLDYLDGSYQHGDKVHVPVLDGRQYLCTTIAPNILESQYLLSGLPFGNSYLSLGGQEGTVEASGGFGSGWTASYAHHSGVQSPRTGIVTLDVTARFGAAVSALGMGDAGSFTAPTGQWGNGTIMVDASFSAGPATVTLGTFAIDTHEIVEESYLLEGGQCFGRFVTMPDDSGLFRKTVTVPADQGEHIPLVLNLTAAEDGAVVGTGPFRYGSTSSFVMRDGTAETRSVTATDSGTITGASLTLDWADMDGYESIAVYGGGSYNGGTLVSVTTPGGATHTLPPHSEYGGPGHTFDLGFLAGEEMAGHWTITLYDQGHIPTASGNNLLDNTLNSWELGFERAGMSYGQICGGTDFESVIVQFLLRTFVVDVS